MDLLQFVLMIICSIALAIVAGYIAVNRWGGSLIKISIVGGILTALATTGSVLVDGMGMQNLQVVLLCCVFLYGSYGDIKTHTADDLIHIIVLAIALIAKPVAEIPMSILAALVTGGIMLLVTMVFSGAGIGGADIKFVAVCAFLTTFEGGLLGLGLGTFSGLLFNSPFRKKKEGAKEGFPMLPYLSCSYMLMYLLF